LNSPISVYTIGRAVAGIKLENVSKIFGGVVAVDDVSLEIADGEFLVLVGPSGCGKSTLLRMIAGLEQATRGGISIGGRDVTDLAPKDRDVAMVFQSYALYPHMSVRQNLGYGLKVRGIDKVETARRVEEVAGLLGLSALLDRRPGQLSGGQRQRVAMGRAIVREPQAYLLDEPLSNLDAQLRVGMRASLAQLHGRLKVTTVYVTHDQVEAMTLGQRVAVMRSGKIVQIDAPQRLYSEPRDVYVAAFIGSPAMNLVEATVEDGVARFGDFAIPLPAGTRPADGEVILGIRPEDFEDAANAPGRPTIEVTVEVLEELGSDSYVFFSVAARPVLPPASAPDASDDPRGLIPAAGALLTARVDARTTARVGGRAALGVDPRRLHFFDRDTGLRLEREATSAGAPAELTTSR
jgi:multiple sugar transport system ATP-binding protein